MRFKSLPLTVRAAPRSSRPGPKPSGQRGPRRMRDWIATIPVLLLVPALLLVGGQAGAGTTALRAPGQVFAGEQIVVTGRNLPRNARIQIFWDGSARAMPTAKTNDRGEIRVRLVVPRRATPGGHTIAALRVDRGRFQTTAGVAWRRAALASTPITVLSASALEARPSQGGSSATASPTPTSEPTRAPTPTAVPTPAPTVASVATPAPTTAPAAPAPTAAPVRSSGTAAVGSILISRDRLMSLPTSGAAWNALVNHANGFNRVNLADQEDDNDTRLLALALVTARSGGDVGPVHRALAQVPGTEGADTLALGRNLAPVVLAADLVGYRDPAFATWLRGVLRTSLDGRTLISTHEDRPNNWGTHAGASRIAADLYLGDTADLGRAAAVFRGWLGERSVYAGFNYGEVDWQANPSSPVGINPRGATKDGRNIDGVLPDDQRRAGGFTWPPPKENYVYEALQGALLQAELLSRAGYPAYQWGDNALARAFAWLHNVAGFPAEGDDSWQPHLVNARYGTGYPAPMPSRPGKGFGFADWLYR